MNEITIRHTFELFKQENELIEVRVIGSGGKTYSGYFKDVDKIVKEVQRFQNENIYFVFNPINDACYSREQCDRFLEKPKVATANADIDKRNWILIDVDPIRPTGISATDEEKQAAKEIANKIFIYLRDFGFSAPICCDSGNGSHLLYKVDLPNDTQSEMLVKTILMVLYMFFSNDKAQVDKGVFNSSRITKLYGTTSRKGKHTEIRPHRESCIKLVPDLIKETPKDLLLKLAALLPQPEKKTYSNNYGTDKFDLDKFISDNSIEVDTETTFTGGKKYILKHCLFNEQHKGKDAAIFKMDDGVIAYKCFHNSCSGLHWRDVRLKYEPTAYDVKEKEYTKQRDVKPMVVIPQKETVEKGNKFIQLHEIKNYDRSKIISIESGFTELDKKIIGFNKGEVSVWSGKNGSAKSTILNQIAINACNNGFKVLIYSGELTPQRLKNWTHLQCAGRQFTKATKYENMFYVPSTIGDKIDIWLKNKLFVYNNDYGNKVAQLLIDIEEHIKANEVDMIILDNVMSLDLEEYSGDKYEQQKKTILSISEFAKNKNVHIHLVAHPRKSVMFLRKEDISGTADLTNRVDNVFIVHRVNNDFNKAISEYFGKEQAANFSTFTNVIEVCKNRDLGIQDYLTGYFFEIESKRILNQRYENIVYGWQDIEIQQSIQPNLKHEELENIFYNNDKEPFGVDDAPEEIPF